MNIRFHSVLSFAVIAVASAVTRGAIIGDLSVAGTTPSAGHAYFGQSFQVPVGETGITSFTLVPRNDGGPFAATARIYAFDAVNNAFVGSPLFSAPLALASGGSQAISTTANLPVIAGQSYAIIADLGGPVGSIGTSYRSSYYPDGLTLFAGADGVPVAFPGLDLAFQVEFGAIPEPASLLGLAALPMALLRRR